MKVLFYRTHAHTCSSFDSILALHNAQTAYTSFITNNR